MEKHLICCHSAKFFSGVSLLGLRGAYPGKPGVVYDRQHFSVNTISIDDFDESLFTSAATCGPEMKLGHVSNRSFPMWTSSSAPKTPQDSPSSRQGMQKIS